MEHFSLHTKRRFGLYIHVPFCKSKCSYCDFYRIVDLTLLQQFVASANIEMSHYAPFVPPLSTIYIGGGTPSILKSNLIAPLLHSITTHFDCSNIDEFTVECNPEDVDNSLAETLHSFGVNRISLGVQSLDDKMLKFINRRHSAQKVFSSIDILRNAGFNNISADIIFGLPPVDNFSFTDDIQRFLSLNVNHLSAYSLSYEEGSWLTRLVNQGKIKPLDDDAVADQYNILTSSLHDAGYLHYEVSNYALPGFHSRHNTDCWQRIPYLGIGPGAFSFDGQNRWNNILNVKQYIQLITQKNSQTSHISITSDLQTTPHSKATPHSKDNILPLIDSITENHESLSSIDIYNEVVMLGLRTSKGININDIPSAHLTQFHTLSNTLISDSLLATAKHDNTTYYHIPESKWFLLDMITEKLMQ